MDTNLPTSTVPTLETNGDPVSIDVVHAVASAAECSPTSLPPLARSIDPDALDALVTGAGMRGDGTYRVTFEYCGYEVTVDGDGRVDVEAGSD